MATVPTRTKVYVTVLCIGGFGVGLPLSIARVINGNFFTHSTIGFLLATMACGAILWNIWHGPWRHELSVELKRLRERLYRRKLYRAVGLELLGIALYTGLLSAASLGDLHQQLDRSPAFYIISTCVAYLVSRLCLILVRRAWKEPT